MGWSRERDDGLVAAGADEVSHGGKTAAVGAHAERDFSFVEHGHQLASGVAEVEQEQVVGLQAVQILEQDLAFFVLVHVSSSACMPMRKLPSGGAG